VANQATSVSEYLASLPDERKRALSKVRAVIKKNIPKGYRETMQYGMISYVVPLTRYPDGYLKKKDVPLPFLSLGAQKNYLALYLMNVYGDPALEKWFRAAWSKSGKKLDMGKSCLRFRGTDDLALDVIGEAVSRTSVDAYVERYEASRKQPRTR
jgi:hypothetical protein